MAKSHSQRGLIFRNLQKPVPNPWARVFYFFHLCDKVKKQTFIVEQMKVSYSRMYLAIAKIAEYLEDHIDPEEFIFLDGGKALRIEAETLEQIGTNNCWQKLQKDFEKVGGYIFSP